MYHSVTKDWPHLIHLHSSGRQITSLCQRHPVPVVYMHPNAAASEAIADREPVCIETRPGRVLQKVCLSNSLDMRVANADFGWRFPEPGNRELHGWKSSSICLLFANQTLKSPEAGALK